MQFIPNSLLPSPGACSRSHFWPGSTVHVLDSNERSQRENERRLCFAACFPVPNGRYLTCRATCYSMGNRAVRRAYNRAAKTPSPSRACAPDASLPNSASPTRATIPCAHLSIASRCPQSCPSHSRQSLGSARRAPANDAIRNECAVMPVKSACHARDVSRVERSDAVSQPLAEVDTSASRRPTATSCHMVRTLVNGPGHTITVDPALTATPLSQISATSARLG